MRSYVKDDVLNLKPYKADDHRPSIMLDANENPFCMQAKLAEVILSSIDIGSLNRYCNSRADELCRKLAGYIGYGITGDMVMAGDGSDELIGIIISGLIKKGQSIIIITPGFSMYNIYSLINEAKIVEFPREEDFSVNIDKLIDAANKIKPSAVFICNPNNPTGTLMPKEDICRLAEELECALVVDEAYFEFSKVTATDMVYKYDNLIILRTMSKAWGLAGLRIGYLISNKYMVKELLKVKPPYNVNSITQQIACIALEHRSIMEDRVKIILEEKERLVSCLQNIKGFKVYDSSANFVLVKVNDADRLTCRLRDNGIAVRNFNGSCSLSNCVRITIGTTDENIKLVNTIKSLEGELIGKNC